MIEMKWLRALTSVSSSGSVAGAAERLGYTPTAVSQQIKQLERQLGAALVAPAGRGIVLTPAGRSLVDAAPEIFQAIERAEAEARAIGSAEPSGTLHVVAFSTAIRGLVAPAVAVLGARWPRLTLRISEEDPALALTSVLAGRADVAVVHDDSGDEPAPAASLGTELLAEDGADVVMRADHPLGRRASLGADDLVGEAWVSSPPSTVCHRWLQHLVAQVPGRSEIRHLVDDFATQLALVRADGVLALLPRMGRPPLGPDLVALPVRPALVRRVQVVWRHSSASSPALQAVLGALRSP